MVALSATRGQALTIPVRVVNRTTVDFGWAIGLSYDVFASDGRLVKWDNPRTTFHPPLSPGAEQQVNLGVDPAGGDGVYRLEVDMVWEGIAWFKDRGNHTSTVHLTVNYRDNRWSTTMRCSERLRDMEGAPVLPGARRQPSDDRGAALAIAQEVSVSGARRADGHVRDTRLSRPWAKPADCFG